MNNRYVDTSRLWRAHFSLPTTEQKEWFILILSISHQDKMLLCGKEHIARVAIGLRTAREGQGALTRAAMVGPCRNRRLRTACCCSGRGRWQRRRRKT
jgi:hypothetical protein